MRPQAGQFSSRKASLERLLGCCHGDSGLPPYFTTFLPAEGYYRIMNSYVPRGVGFLACMCLLSGFLLSCGGGSSSNLTTTAPAPDVGTPLIDMQASQTYLGFSGNLYENNSNSAPADHAA